MDHTTPRTPLPARLILAEHGEWVSPSWARDSNDDQWVRYGWKAQTYAGQSFFIHKEQSFALQWLAERGYKDTGDGAHYHRSESNG
jgi:hypothetical protein